MIIKVNFSFKPDKQKSFSFSKTISDEFYSDIWLEYQNTVNDFMNKSKNYFNEETGDE